MPQHFCHCTCVCQSIYSTHVVACCKMLCENIDDCKTSIVGYNVANAVWSWEIVSENRSVGVLRVFIPQVQIDEATHDDDHFRRRSLSRRSGQPSVRARADTTILSTGDRHHPLAMDRLPAADRTNESKLVECAVYCATATGITAKIDEISPKWRLCSDSNNFLW